MKASRATFAEINKKFAQFPFTLRALDDETQARMGITECRNHALVEEYPVIYERQGDHVVHIKFTLLLLASGPARVTGFPHLEGGYTSDKTEALPEDIKAILAQVIEKKKKKKKNNKKK